MNARSKSIVQAAVFVIGLLFSIGQSPLQAQDWVRTGSNLTDQKIRLAAADFKPVGGDPQTPSLKATFDSTLFSDLSNAGIFDMVSKSMAPTVTPGSPQEISSLPFGANLCTRALP